MGLLGFCAAGTRGAGKELSIVNRKFLLQVHVGLSQCGSPTIRVKHILLSVRNKITIIFNFVVYGQCFCDWSTEEITVGLNKPQTCFFEKIA
jgi:hypothetical protein